MADDIIDIEDYEVTDTQIVETSDEDDYRGQYNQREYDNQGSTTGFYKSFTLNNTSLLIIGMVVLVLVVIFIMTFD
jgi:hypothetical protein